MYLIIPFVLGFYSCSVTKEITENMIFVNGPKDLEYRINAGNATAYRNISVLREIKETNAVNKHYFDLKFVPYQQSGININAIPNTPYYSVPLLPKK
jgi:hypothetical protein